MRIDRNTIEIGDVREPLNSISKTVPTSKSISTSTRRLMRLTLPRRPISLRCTSPHGWGTTGSPARRIRAIIYFWTNRHLTSNMDTALGSRLLSYSPALVKASTHLETTFSELEAHREYFWFTTTCRDRRFLPHHQHHRLICAHRSGRLGSETSELTQNNDCTETKCTYVGGETTSLWRL